MSINLNNMTWSTNTNINTGMPYITSTTPISTSGAKYENTIKYVYENVISTKISEETLKQLIPQLDEARERLEEEEAARELKNRQDRNKRLRGLIKQVIFSGPVTIVKWNDGTITRVRCAEGEEYDQEKGLLAAMAKKLYENTNIFVEELAYWCDDPDDDYDDDDFEAYRQVIDERNWQKLRDWFENEDD